MSEYEAHPVAVMEALSMKRPVLVADTSGLRELAQKGWVRAVSLDTTPDDLASAIVEGLAFALCRTQANSIIAGRFRFAVK